MRKLVWAVLVLTAFWGFACDGKSSSSEDGGLDAGCDPQDVFSVSYGPRDDTFWVGPYLGHTTQTTAAISWETELAGSTRVEYGPDEGYGQQADGQAGTLHHVLLEGLEPASRYHYRACTESSCTADLSFSTAPMPGQSFRFAVYGDTRSDPPMHELVSESMVESAPVLAVNVGDIVADGNLREEFKQMHFDPTRRLGHYAPVYVAIGNHEMKDYDAEHFRDYLVFPEDSFAGQPELIERQSETSYSFTYGDAFFLVFDATLDHFDMFFPLEGTEPPLWLWLNDQVVSEAAQKARWRFAFTHYPPDSACYDDEDYGWPSSALRDFVFPLLVEHGFQAYFAGHQHDYERFDYDGFLAITTGGGGAGMETVANCLRQIPEQGALHSVHHHMVVDLGCDEALIQAIDVDGLVFDSIRLYPDGRHEAD